MELCLLLTEDEESAATRDVSRHFEDTSYGYKDFSRHGMHVPTFRVQVKGWGLLSGGLGNNLLIVPDTKPGNGCALIALWVRLKASKRTTTTPSEISALESLKLWVFTS